MKNLKNGVYILHNDKLFTVTDWKKQSDPTIADFVVLVTNYGAMKISKKIEGKMTWKEAMRFNLPDLVQGLSIGLNRNILKEAIGFIGGKWFDEFFWTKTKYNPEDGTSYAWFYNGYYGGIGATSKYATGYVRAVTAFQISASKHKVTPDLLDVGLRAVGIKAEKKMIDKIIDIVELIEDKGEATSLKDIAELENEWNK